MLLWAVFWKGFTRCPPMIPISEQSDFTEERSGTGRMGNPSRPRRQEVFPHSCPWLYDSVRRHAKPDERLEWCLSGCSHGQWYQRAGHGNLIRTVLFCPWKSIWKKIYRWAREKEEIQGYLNSFSVKAWNLRHRKRPLTLSISYLTVLASCTLVLLTIARKMRKQCKHLTANSHPHAITYVCRCLYLLHNLCS